MNTNPVYLENLIPALEELGSIKKTLTELEEREKLLRAQILKWMEINELELYEVKDTTAQIWKLKVGTQSRKSISDWVLLESILGPTNSHLIIEKEFDMFTVKQTKKFSDEWLTN